MNERLHHHRAAAVLAGAVIAAAAGGACSAGGGGNGGSVTSNGNGPSQAGSGTVSTGGSGPMIDVPIGASGGTGPGRMTSNWPPPRPAWVDDAGASAVFADGLAPTVSSLFKPASGSGGLNIMYPLSGSLHPVNLGKITFQWPGGESTLFRIEAKTEGNKLFRFYGRCRQLPGGCGLDLPPAFWVDLGVQSEGKPVQITLSATTDSGATTLATTPITVTFTREPLLGAVYYWSTGTKAVMRASMDSLEPAVPFIEPHSPTNEFGCTGCHTVSRDGHTIGFNVDTENAAGGPIAVQTANVEDPKQAYIRPSKNGQGQPTSHIAFFPALNPDGSKVAITTHHYAQGVADVFELWDARTGAVLDSIPIGDPRLLGATNMAVQPEWSPDGTKLAVALGERSCMPDLFMACGSTAIAVLPVTGNTIGSATSVARAASGYLFYPTWSPDGQYLAFARSTVAHSNDPGSAVSLHLVKVDGQEHSCPGNGCRSLTIGQMNGTATWPKFTPFSVDQNRYVFLSMSSEASYGVYPGRTRLWMFGIDLTNTTADPSFSPVWLPQQALEDNTLQAIWTEKLPCAAAGGAASCQGCVAGERCVVEADQCYCLANPPQ